MSNTPPPYQATITQDEEVPAQSTILPTHERDRLLPSGQQSSSRFPSKRNGNFKILEVFFYMGIGMIIGANIQRAFSTSIFDPAVRDQIREEWEVTYANHDRRMDRMQEAWQVEAQRYSQLQLDIIDERKKWDAERRVRERIREEERMEEVERRRRERQKEIEEEERKRANLSWGELKKSDQCLRYGARKYSAKLQVPEDYNNSVKGCRETEIEIHGRKLLPTDCDDQGTWGGVWGHWIVDFDEASCGTYWKDYYDEGCTAEESGLRRIHQRLYNYNPTDDWNDMCSSTPTKFNGISFDVPTSCKNLKEDGVYGFWEIDDGACR